MLTVGIEPNSQVILTWFQQYAMSGRITTKGNCDFEEELRLDLHSFEGLGDTISESKC